MKHYFIYFNIQLYNIPNIKGFIFFTTSLKYNFFILFYSLHLFLSLSLCISSPKQKHPSHHLQPPPNTAIIRKPKRPPPSETQPIATAHWNPLQNTKIHWNPLWNKLKSTVKPNPTHCYPPAPPTPTTTTTTETHCQTHLYPTHCHCPLKPRSEERL